MKFKKEKLSGVPCSLSPEEALERFVNELKHPINSVKGYAIILQKPDYQDRQQEAIEAIIKMAERMEALCELITDYLAECFEQ